MPSLFAPQQPQHLSMGTTPIEMRGQLKWCASRGVDRLWIRTGFQEQPHVLRLVLLDASMQRILDSPAGTVRCLHRPEAILHQEWQDLASRFHLEALPLCLSCLLALVGA